MTEKQLKELMDRLKSIKENDIAADERIKSLEKAIEAKDANVEEIRDAMKQLEVGAEKMAASIEKKLASIRTTAWDADGNYRGMFGNEQEARGFGLWVLGTVGKNEEALKTFNREYRSVMTTDDMQIPIEFSKRIDREIDEVGIWPREAFRMPMTQDKMSFQRRTAGLKCYKTGQKNAAKKSAAGFSTINLIADEWNVLCCYSKSLDEEAAAEVGEMIAVEIIQAHAETLDDGGFQGDGTEDYLDVWGICPLLIKINGVDDGGGLVVAGGNVWAEITEADFTKLISICPAYAAKKGKFYCSHEFYWTVMAPIQMAKGGTTMAELANGPTLMFMGKEVVTTQSMSRAEANSQVCVIFGDMRRSSTHGVRKDMIIEKSSDAYFEERQIGVLSTQKHAVSNHTLGDADNAGPVVGMVTAAG